MHMLSNVDTKSISIEYECIGSSDDGPFRSYQLQTEGATLLELVNNAYVWEVDQDGGDHEGGSLGDYRTEVYAEGVAVIRRACRDNGIWVPDTPCEFCHVAEASHDGQYCKPCVPYVETAEQRRREIQEHNENWIREITENNRLYAIYMLKYGVKACRTYDEHKADEARGVPRFEDWKKSHARQDVTLADLWAHTGDAEDFPEDSDAYFAMRAIEIHGSALRDNSLAELVAIGKRDEAVNE
jgi:hypothetical protein